jgi:transposase
MKGDVKKNTLAARLGEDFFLTSPFGELTRFAKGLREDEAAVQAAMEYEWSNGQVEGQVNHLKMVKRQMFGRANLDLLKARVLNAAGSVANKPGARSSMLVD